jgi:hypothetical protein
MAYALAAKACTFVSPPTIPLVEISVYIWMCTSMYWWVRESARLVRWTALAGSHTYAPSGALWPNSSLCFCLQTGR